MLFHGQKLNPCPLSCKGGILTIGLPGNFPAMPAFTWRQQSQQACSLSIPATPLAWRLLASVGSFLETALQFADVSSEPSHSLPSHNTATLWAGCKQPDKRLCCCSVTTLCLTLCHSMNCRMPSSPVLHYLLEFAETHVHQVNHALWLYQTLRIYHTRYGEEGASEGFEHRGEVSVKFISVNSKGRVCKMILWKILLTNFSTSFQEVHSFTSGKALPWGPQCAAMASCHSLILLDGTIQGDPLDLKMFEGTAWVRWLFLGSTEWRKCEEISNTHWECLGFPNFGRNPENHSSVRMNEGLILPESPNLCSKTL